MMKCLNKEQGVTTIMVSHDDSLSKQAKRRVRMKDGKVAKK